MTHWIGEELLAEYLYPINAFSAPAFVAVPPYIEIGYNESVTIDIGLMRLKTGEFKNEPLQRILIAEYYTYEVVKYPSKNIDKKWRVYFDPPLVNVDEGVKQKTKATISLSSPPVGGEAIQSGILVIRINKNTAWGDLWHLGPVWFISALAGKWGKFSGTTDSSGRNVSILVKVKPYHEVIFDTPRLIELKPNQVATVPLNLTNLGNYKDTIGFRIISKNEGIELTDPIYVTLKPGETKPTLLGIGVYPRIWDSGTIHQVKIQAFSLGQPNVVIAERNIFLETRGIYLSEVNVIGFLLSVTIIILIVGFLLYRRRKIWERYCKKPDKPWKFSEEKKHLEKLKKENKTGFHETLKMMRDEYKSALLWYKHYLKAAKMKKYIGRNQFISKIKSSCKKIKKIRFKKLFKSEIKKSGKKIERKRERNVPHFFQEIGKKSRNKNKVEKKESTKNDRIEDFSPKKVEKNQREHQRKYQIMNKIKHEQQKQRKKIKKRV